MVKTTVLRSEVADEWQASASAHLKPLLTCAPALLAVYAVLVLHDFLSSLCRRAHATGACFAEPGDDVAPGNVLAMMCGLGDCSVHPILMDW